MLNRIIFAVFLIWLASELVSWANPPKFQPVPTWHEVKAGESFWSIACLYFDEQDRYRELNEWVYWVRKANEPQMRGKKYLPVGMTVAIPIERRVE